MEDLMKYIAAAWDRLGRIAVSGDAVDMLAAARMELRHAYAAAQQTQETQQTQEMQQTQEENADADA